MTTHPDRDDQVMTLIAAAMPLDGEERSRYLHVACGEDGELFDEVRDALEWEQRMGGFLQKPWMSLQNLERPFRPGQLVNNRFEIVREIGEGGMGIVYEAFDRKRGHRIAIKSAKLGFRRLLSPELESALKVRHPNICLVNEIHTAATEYGDLDFLTMELLDGPTLAASLASGDRLDPGEALEIARQLCAGLAEAHRIGIVHKDLKSTNVILTRMPDGSPRAVITDFGLAGEPAIESGDLAGTPRYMAPELWRGAAASKASDIYALGVILYEMVTGASPFVDEPTQIRLTRAPAPPSSRTGPLDKRWDTAILRCLDPSPAARPSGASDVFVLLTKRRIRKAPLLAAAAVLIVASVALREPLRQFIEPPSVRLAMLPLQANDDVAAIGNGVLNDVADRLTHRGGGPTLVVIPPQRSLASDVRTPAQAYETLHATHALQVSLRREGNDLLARGTVIDLATQTQLQEISGRYAAGDLLTALTGAVSKALRLRGMAGEPISAAAATPYLNGLAYLRKDQHSFDRAIPFFRTAEALDPHSSLPKAALVEALLLHYADTKDQGILGQAIQVLRKAEALNPASVAVLLAKARLGTVQGQYEKALESYKEVADLQPRNVEVWLRIADVYDKLDRRKEAVESYQRAVALEPAYYETYEEFGVFYFGRGECAEAAAQFRKVIQYAPRFLEAYTNLGAALTDMGQYTAAEQALFTSLGIKETARALNSLGAARAYQRRDGEAVVHYKKALALNPRSYICLMNLGDANRREGLEAECRDAYERGAALAQETLQNNPRNASARAYVGYFAARLGDRARGQQEIEQALQLEPKDQGVIRRAVLLYVMLGDRERALKIAEAATADVLGALDRHPDLADFHEDPRFKELRKRREKGG